MKVYPDTTVLLAAFLVNDLSAQWLRRMLTSPHELLIGIPVARDFSQTMQDRLGVPTPRFANVLKVLKRQTFVPATRFMPNDPLPDPDDAQVLGCALEAKADYFITGDRMLLELERVDGLPILSPQASWSILFP